MSHGFLAAPSDGIGALAALSTGLRGTASAPLAVATVLLFTVPGAAAAALRGAADGWI